MKLNVQMLFPSQKLNIFFNVVFKFFFLFVRLLASCTILTFSIFLVIAVNQVYPYFYCHKKDTKVQNLKVEKIKN